MAPKSTSSIVLTDVQQDIIRMVWDKQPIDVVTQKAFSNPALTLNSPEAAAVRAFIASLGAPPKKKDGVRITKLTDEQKATVASLLNSENPPTVKEMTKMLFPDIANLTPLNTEYRLVYALVRELNEEAIDLWDEPVESRRYHAPTTYSSIIGLANRYVGNAVNPTKALYDANNIKKIHESNLKALLSYVQTTKFVMQASLYDKKADRELFESTFVRLTHDKAADLIPEEVDMYIAAATETAEVSRLQRDIIRYERVITDYLDGDMDGEKRSNLSKPFVDALTALRQKLGEAKKRLKDTLESVAGSRSARVNTKGNQNDSLATLINLWTEEQSRNDLIALAQKEHNEDDVEFGRIQSLDDAIALMAGMTREEARSGV